MNITISPELVELGESEAGQPVEFLVRKDGLAERPVEVIAFTRNVSYHGELRSLALATFVLMNTYSVFAQQLSSVVGIIMGGSSQVFVCNFNWVSEQPKLIMLLTDT